MIEYCILNSRIMIVIIFSFIFFDDMCTWRDGIFNFIQFKELIPY